MRDSDIDPEAVTDDVGEPRDRDTEGEELSDCEADSVMASARDSISTAATRARTASIRLKNIS